MDKNKRNVSMKSRRYIDTRCESFVGRNEMFAKMFQNFVDFMIEIWRFESLNITYNNIFVLYNHLTFDFKKN